MRGFASRIAGAIFACAVSVVSVSVPAHAIIGGSEVHASTHSAHFSSVLFLESSSQTCTAVYIGDGKVLTAGHCVMSMDRTRVEPAENLLVRGGSRIRNSGGTIAKVSNVHLHPEYERKTAGANDVAVLILDRNLPGVQAAEIATNSDAYEAEQVGYLSGWGFDETGTLPLALRQATLRLLSPESCIAEQPVGSIKGPMMCARLVREPAKEGENAFIGGGAAKGDSGGPLLIHTTKGMRLIGISSWFSNPDPNPTTSRNGITVFTRVDVMAEWVKKISQ